MVYQPLFDLPRLVPVGAEALSRFPQGTPDPADWFRNAHSVGLGVELELAALSNAFPSLDEVTGFLSVNVSSETVCSPKFGRMPAALPMHRIVIELTEHAPIEDYDTLNEALGPLRRNGLRVAIDDAGAGYACMRHILSIVPDFISSIGAWCVASTATFPGRRWLPRSPPSPSPRCPWWWPRGSRRSPSSPPWSAWASTAQHDPQLPSSGSTSAAASSP